jgi:hypothetical protein
VNLQHTVYRFPGFLSSHPNCVPPPPNPQGNVAPPFGSKGGDTLACGGGGGEAQFRRRDRYSGTLCVLHRYGLHYFCISSSNRALGSCLRLHTVRKSYPFSLLQPGCHLLYSPWPGIIKLFPARETVSDIQAGDGKMVNYSEEIILGIYVRRPERFRGAEHRSRSSSLQLHRPGSGLWT